MRAKKFAEPVTIRMCQADLTELRRISRTLELDQAEICRRAVRIGLDELRHVRLPGGIENHKRLSLNAG